MYKFCSDVCVKYGSTRRDIDISGVSSTNKLINKIKVVNLGNNKPI